jgi:hypothetical protein
MLNLGIFYNNQGNAKQPDSSFIPHNLPAPTRQNGLKFQPGTGQLFPTLCFEVSVSNEDRDRLLSDAEEKYFAADTSVGVWVGLKIILELSGGETFWCGWGRRKETGSGLRLVDQTEDQEGFACFIPVHDGAVAGVLRIPSRLVFPVNPPNNIPPNLTITFESLRLNIIEGLAIM